MGDIRVTVKRCETEIVKGFYAYDEGFHQIEKSSELSYKGKVVDTITD